MTFPDPKSLRFVELQEGEPAFQFIARMLIEEQRRRQKDLRIVDHALTILRERDSEAEREAWAEHDRKLWARIEADEAVERRSGADSAAQAEDADPR